MPAISLKLAQKVPLIDIHIGVSAPRQAALMKAGEAVPPPILVRALIDTGASGTCVDPSVLVGLNLTPTGNVPCLTPSTAGVPHLMDQYDVSVIMPTQRPSYSLPTLAVMGSHLADQGIQALIGRDILQHCLLVYNGLDETFTLAF